MVRSTNRLQATKSLMRKLVVGKQEGINPCTLTGTRRVMEIGSWTIKREEPAQGWDGMAAIHLESLNMLRMEGVQPLYRETALRQSGVHGTAAVALSLTCLPKS